MSKALLTLAGGLKVATEQAAHGDSGVAQFQHVIATELGSVPRLFPKYLATNPGGVIDMAVDGSVTPVAFDLVPGSAQIWRVTRLTLQIIAATAAAPELFGDLGALANGVLVELRNAGGVLVDLTAGAPIKANRDLALGWSTTIADTVVGAEWAFAAAPVRVEGGLGEFLRVTVRDNLTGLTRMRILAECLDETVLT